MVDALITGRDALVSVVIPSRDRPDFLRRAIDSVLAQTYRPLELLLVDDGSEQAIEIEAQAFRDAGIDVHLLRNEISCGVAAARNKGILAARGEWVAFLDDDDRWAANKIEKQLSMLRDMPRECRASACHLVLQDAAGNETGRARRPVGRQAVVDGLLYADNNLEPSTLLVQRAVFDDVGLFREDFPTAEDREWLLRYLLKLDICVVDDFLVLFTQHSGDRLTRDHRLMAVGERKFLDVVQHRVALLQGSFRRAMGYRHAKLAHETILSGDTPAALSLYLKAVMLNPFDIRSVLGLMAALTGPGMYRRIVSLRMSRLRG